MHFDTKNIPLWLLVTFLCVLLFVPFSYATSAEKLFEEKVSTDVYCAPPLGLKDNADYFENRIASQLKRNYPVAKVSIRFLRKAPVKIGGIESHPNVTAGASSVSIQGVTFVGKGRTRSQACRLRIPVMVDIKTTSADGSIERLRRRSSINVTGVKILKDSTSFNGSKLCCDGERNFYS